MQVWLWPFGKEHGCRHFARKTQRKTNLAVGPVLGQQGVFAWLSKPKTCFKNIVANGHFHVNVTPRQAKTPRNPQPVWFLRAFCQETQRCDNTHTGLTLVIALEAHQAAVNVHQEKQRDDVQVQVEHLQQVITVRWVLIDSRYSSVIHAISSFEGLEGLLFCGVKVVPSSIEKCGQTERFLVNLSEPEV